MKNLMDTIISIDKQAENRLNEAIRRKQEAMAKIDEEKRHMTEQMKQHAKDLLSNSEEAEKVLCEEQKRQIAQRVDSESSRLQGIFDQNHQQWVSEIVENVLK